MRCGTGIVAACTAAVVLLSTTSIAAATDLGWQQTSGSLPAFAADAGGPIELACTSTTTCTGLAGADTSDTGNSAETIGSLYTDDGGQDWSGTPFYLAGTSPSEISLTPNSVDCVDGAFPCFALAYTDNNSPNFFSEEYEATSDTGDGVWTPLGETEVTPTMGSPSVFSGDDLSCVSASDCVAASGLDTVGDAAFLFSDNDDPATWLSNAPFASDDHPIKLLTVSCITASDCWAGGIINPTNKAGANEPAIAATTDGGTDWSDPETLPALTGIEGIEELTCVADPAAPTDPSDADCYAVGYDGGNGAGFSGGTAPVILSSADGGATWAQDGEIVDTSGTEVALTGAGFSGITCASQLECFAYVGTPSDGSPDLLVTVDGGQYWISESVSGTPAVASVSCPDGSDCFIGAGGAVDETNDAGFPSGLLADVSDVTATVTGPGAANVTWTQPPIDGGATRTGYDVTIDNETTSATTAETATADATSYGASGLTAGDTYEFKVEAVGADAAHSFTISSNTIVATAASSSPPPAKPALKLQRGTITVSHGKADLKLSCTGAPCHGTLTLTATKAKKAIGQASYSLAKGATRTITIKLSSKGAKLLRKARKHRLGATAKATLTGGKAVSASVTLVG